MGELLPGSVILVGSLPRLDRHGIYNYEEDEIDVSSHVRLLGTRTEPEVDVVPFWEGRTPQAGYGTSSI